MRQYGTLRHRIQSGMFYSASFSTLLLMLLMIFLLLITFLATGIFFSKSVNQDIYARLDMIMEGDTQKPSGPDLTNLKDLSLEELISFAQTHVSASSSGPASATTDTTDTTDTTEAPAAPEAPAATDWMNSESMVPKVMMVEALTEEVKKKVALAMISALTDFKATLPYKKWLDLDMVLVEFKDANNEKILCIPITTEAAGTSGASGASDASGSGTSIEKLENASFLQKPIVKALFEQSISTLTIRSLNGELLATITTSINPDFVLFLMFIIAFMTIVVLCASFPINMLLIKFHAKNILRPIDTLNKQMKALAHNDFYGISDFHFQVKRPPHELVMLMDSATQIMERLNDNNTELDAQKQELEAQNQELEAQNTALSESKAMIQDQQDQLVRSEKMATLGQISAAIAHEINTPLGAIKSNTQMMKMVLDQFHISDAMACLPPAEAKKLGKLRDMNEITNTASERVTEIIKSLKNFSRIDQADFQKFDVHEGLDSVLVLTSNLWKNTITIEKNYGPIPPIEGFASMLNQVFMNIVVNAVQAMVALDPNEKGTLTITTALRDQWLSISFKDTGGGIPDHLLERVFESGFTTKEAHQGTGLGLAISRDIIAKHRGRIFATSPESKQGATFVIELPISQKAD